MPLRRLAATGSPQYDELDTLGFRGFAHDMAGLTFKLPRLDFSSDPARQLLRLRQGLRTLGELSLDESALTIGRLLVTTRPSWRHLQPGSVRWAANENK
jgi:hypothetical protein